MPQPTAPSRFPRRAAVVCALGFIAGGALGDIVDHGGRGAADFIDVYVDSFSWPTFDLADTAIALGVALLLLLTMRSKPTTTQRSQADAGSGCWRA